MLQAFIYCCKDLNKCLQHYSLPASHRSEHAAGGCSQPPRAPPLTDWRPCPRPKTQLILAPDHRLHLLPPCPSPVCSAPSCRSRGVAKSNELMLRLVDRYRAAPLSISQTGIALVLANAIKMNKRIDFWRRIRTMYRCGKRLRSSGHFSIAWSRQSPPPSWPPGGCPHTDVITS